MNLTKLFNFSYFWQNIKKSKGLMILILTVVPILTSIMILTIGKNEIFSFAEVSIINIIGMYILPVVLSMALFNYIYKKNSVDFMGSMPLSRKTIFITNTVGGIGVIVLMQLLTAIATFALSKIISNVVIFGSMIWDIFVFFTVAYIFVFVVSNLAMSFSGNRFSQIATILLILFLIPFLVVTNALYGNVTGNYYDYDLNANEAEISFVEPYNFTAPSHFVDLLFGADYEYDSDVVLKTALLSLVYIIIGLFIFNRKKFEMAGESFENEKIHLFVKGLTLVPFFAVFCSLDGEDEMRVGLFFLAILAVYYFVFDLITNKKIKAGTSILSFIASAFVLFCFYEGLAGKINFINQKKILLDNVQTVTLDSFGNGYSRVFDFGLSIDDHDLIEKILLLNSRVYYEASPSVIPSTYTSVVTVPDAMSTTGDTPITNKAYHGENFILTIVLKNGKKYTCEQYINGNILEEIMNYATDKQVDKSYAKVAVKITNLPLTKEQRDEIVALINEEMNVSYSELYNKYNEEYTNNYIDLYEYKNHQLVKKSFSTLGFKNLCNYVISINNQYTLKNINMFRVCRLLDSKIGSVIIAKNPEIFTSEFENMDEYTEKERLLDEISWGEIVSYDVYKNFIKQEAGKEFNIEKEYITLYCYNPATYYYTNDIEGLYRVVAKEVNRTGEFGFRLNEE